MAEIYLARSRGIRGFEKYVVLKRILPQFAASPQFVEMFFDEARLAASLHHQNIAQVYDIGRFGDGYFFTMEYLHGIDLRDLLKRVAGERTRVPLQHVLTIGENVAAALDYAHDRRDNEGNPLHIVHRDVSPSNILLTYDGGVKVVDFGIARATQHQAETYTGSLKGKIPYMSPEQCQGADIDRRSDVFSLGIVLWELTTGRSLFRQSKGESDYQVMERIVHGHLPALEPYLPDCPTHWKDILHHALETNPAHRFASARELLLEIERFAAAQGLPLSQASLSDYVQGLFGQPPEPWQGMDRNPRESSVPSAPLELMTSASIPFGAHATSGSQSSVPGSIGRSQRRGLRGLAIAATLIAFAALGVTTGQYAYRSDDDTRVEPTIDTQPAVMATPAEPDEIQPAAAAVIATEDGAPASGAQDAPSTPSVSASDRVLLPNTETAADDISEDAAPADGSTATDHDDRSDEAREQQRPRKRGPATQSPKKRTPVTEKPPRKNEVQDLLDRTW